MADLTLDHVIIGVADLRVAADAVSAVLGRHPSWRGRHPSYGTANVLFRLDNAYVELLAPDPEATTDTAWTGSLGRFLKERGEGLFSIALQTGDVLAAAARARDRGLPVEEPLPGFGQDIDSGAVREWVNARVPPESTRGTRCFFIEHRSPASVLPLAAAAGAAEGAVTGVAAVVVASRESGAARRMWREVFELSETVVESGWRFELGNATLFLQADLGGEGAAPDRWHALVLSVPGLHAAAARLEGAGLKAERAGVDMFEGLSVTACGTTFLLTEGK